MSVVRAHRRMFTLLEATLNRELTETAGFSMADHTVLSILIELEGRQWRLTELAEYMRWLQSRLPHIKRMEARGMVMREQVADDARGAHMELTRSGLHDIAAAARTHVAGVRHHMIDHLTPCQLDTGETVVGKLTDVANLPGSPPPSAG